MNEEPTSPAELVVPDGAEPSAVSRSDEAGGDPAASGPAPAIVEPAKLLQKYVGREVTLVATGGLRIDADFAKAMALGADGVAVANSALQAIGCLGMRACHTNNCPVGIATQKPHLRRRLVVEASARRLANWFAATVELMCVLARACGHDGG